MLAARSVRRFQDVRQRVRALLGLYDWSTSEGARRVLGFYHAHRYSRSLRPLLVDVLEELRPKSREECVSGPRPCPWVGCRYNLALDVSPTGALKLPLAEFADVPTGATGRVRRKNMQREPSVPRRDLKTARPIEDVIDLARLLERMEDLPTCALDAADSGTWHLEEVAILMGITRERVRQIEKRALAKLEAAGVELTGRDT